MFVTDVNSKPFNPFETKLNSGSHLKMFSPSHLKREKRRKENVSPRIP